MTEESQYFREILRHAQNDKNAKIQINRHLLKGKATKRGIFNIPKLVLDDDTVIHTA